MQDDNGKAPPIIGSNRLTVLKPEMSSSPFKYDPLFQSGGENSVFENINNSQPRTNMKKKKTQPPPPQPSPPKSCVPGTAAKVPPRTATWKPRSSLFFFFFRPLRLQSHLEEDLEAPFVVFPWNKTNRIQVFWLALASRSRQRLPPVMWARSCDFRGEPRRSYLCIEMRPAGLERMSANFLPTSNLVTKYREC